MATKKSGKPKTQRPSQRPLADWAADQAKVANINELARASGLNRATVTRRLNEAGVRPKPGSKQKEKLFDLGEATAALAKESRSAQGPAPAPLTHARTQKTTAEAARILLKLQRERGELAPRSEFVEEAYKLVKAMHTRLKRYARESRARFAKLNKPTDVEHTMNTDFDLIFDDLKRDYPNIF